MSAAMTIPLIQADSEWGKRPQEAARPAPQATLGGTAFYRKRAEGLLRRYMRASMEMGRTPSLIGAEIFRGRVSSYRLRTFEDCIIFDLSVLKHQMAALYGDGETGRIASIERRVTAHEQALQRAKGVLLAAAGVFTAIQMLIEFLRYR